MTRRLLRSPPNGVSHNWDGALASRESSMEFANSEPPKWVSGRPTPSTVRPEDLLPLSQSPADLFRDLVALFGQIGYGIFCNREGRLTTCCRVQEHACCDYS